MAGELAGCGVCVVGYDSAGQADARSAGKMRIELADSAEECIAQSGVVTLTTPWPEFAAIPAERWARSGAPRVVIDCWRVLQRLESVHGVLYIGLGLGVAREESAAGGAAQ